LSSRIVVVAARTAGFCERSWESSKKEIKRCHLMMSWNVGAAGATTTATATAGATTAMTMTIGVAGAASR